MKKLLIILLFLFACEKSEKLIGTHIELESIPNNVKIYINNKGTIDMEGDSIAIAELKELGIDDIKFKHVPGKPLFTLDYITDKMKVKLDHKRNKVHVLVRHHPLGNLKEVILQYGKNSEQHKIVKEYINQAIEDIKAIPKEHN